ncbi:MAG: DegT/DnrJ/EryC1/StrS family aminotransferase [Geobacteraceae bacterium]|nr:DegT/DnrJ/EryC1/StrS family aminotransferase [Geobacteraceae bacterium]
MSEKKVEYFRHNLNDDDIALTTDVLRSVFLTTGPKVAAFELRLAEYLGHGHVVGLTSCTAALHLALLRYGIGPGDEVITTAMTFCATATAIIQAGATPILVDVCPQSALLRPEDAEKAITPKTKAIIPVHLYGRMVDMRGFAELAQRHNLIIIEDAAHCIEGQRDGIRPGQLGHAACFSFYATKNITCGEGGALVCHTEEDATWYRSARHHGISKNAASRYTGTYQHWDMEMMGWKYNMDDIQAALLVNQIDRIDTYRSRRQAIEERYRNLLANAKGITLVEPVKDLEISSHHLFTVLLHPNISRDHVLLQLQENGIGCAVNYRAVHTLKYFKETFGFKAENFPVANDIGNRTISLPLYPKLLDNEIDYIASVLCEIADEALSVI